MTPQEIDAKLAEIESQVRALDAERQGLLTLRFANENPCPVRIGQWVKYQGRRMQVCLLVAGMSEWFADVHSPEWSTMHASGRKTRLPAGMTFRTVSVSKLTLTEPPVYLTRAAKQVLFQ